YRTSATILIYTLSLHDALPISFCEQLAASMPVEEVVEASLDHGVAHYTRCPWDFATHLRLYAAAKTVLQDREMAQRATDTFIDRSEEHTSELQSRFDLVCRLLL